jgi:hypothetical protein
MIRCGSAATPRVGNGASKYATQNWIINRYMLSPPHLELWLAKTIRVGLLSGLICIIGCGTNTTNFAPATSLIDTKLLSLSRRGGSSLNCGRVGIRQNPDRASDCALSAFAQKSPFYVRYDLQGIDSEVSAGLAGDAAGNVYFIEYDSMGWETDGLSKGAEVTDGKHIYVEPCPKPVTLRKTRTGRLTCTKSDPNASHNIMSPAFDPY